MHLSVGLNAYSFDLLCSNSFSKWIKFGYGGSMCMSLFIASYLSALSLYLLHIYYIYIIYYNTYTYLLNIYKGIYIYRYMYVYIYNHMLHIYIYIQYFKVDKICIWGKHVYMIIHTQLIIHACVKMMQNPNIYRAKNIKKIL